MNLRTLLEQTGLDTHETSLYLTLVSLKEASAGILAKRGGLPRTYAYKIMNSLIQKGFVRKIETHRSIRKYSITDFDAPKRYLEQQQLELYQLQRKIEPLGSQLENLSQPQTSVATIDILKDTSGYEDFWRLLHSTITREIWICNPPHWWGNEEINPEVKKWELFRLKQHIWEKRFIKEKSIVSPRFIDEYVKSFQDDRSSFFLIDHYQLQISSFMPFRAIRIDHEAHVALLKSLLLANP